MKRRWMIETDVELSRYTLGEASMSLYAREWQRDFPGFGEIAVGLSAEQVEVLRSALERCRAELQLASGTQQSCGLANASAASTVAAELARNALRVLPPKREPTLLEAAQDVLTVHADLADGESFRRLRAAIAREEARKA